MQINDFLIFQHFFFQPHLYKTSLENFPSNPTAAQCSVIQSIKKLHKETINPKKYAAAQGDQSINNSSSMAALHELERRKKNENKINNPGILEDKSEEEVEGVVLPEK